MYKILYQNLISEIYSFKLILMIAIFSIYSIPSLQVAKLNNYNCIEYMIIIFSDHYYILFGLFLIYMCFVAGLKKMNNSIILLRNKNFYSFWFSKLIATYALTAFILFIHIAVALIMSYPNLKKGLSFTNVRFDENLLLFSENFKSPISAFLSIILFLMIGLMFVSIIISFLEIHFDMNIIIFIVCSVYFLSIIALHKNLDAYFPYLFINNYFILHHSINKNITSIISTIILIVSIFINFSVKSSWRIKKYV